jgi:hypothetical protein
MFPINGSSWHLHSFRYDAYLKAAQQFTHSQGAIFDAISAASEIDRVLTDCISSVGCPVAVPHR